MVEIHGSATQFNQCKDKRILIIGFPQHLV